MRSSYVPIFFIFAALMVIVTQAGEDTIVNFESSNEFHRVKVISRSSSRENTELDAWISISDERLHLALTPSAAKRGVLLCSNGTLSASTGDTDGVKLKIAYSSQTVVRTYPISKIDKDVIKRLKQAIEGSKFNSGGYGTINEPKKEIDEIILSLEDELRK